MGDTQPQDETVIGLLKEIRLVLIWILCIVGFLAPIVVGVAFDIIRFVIGR